MQQETLPDPGNQAWRAHTCIDSISLSLSLSSFFLFAEMLIHSSRLLISCSAVAVLKNLNRSLQVVLIIGRGR
jgi:hypothetical protein